MKYSVNREFIFCCLKYFVLLLSSAASAILKYKFNLNSLSRHILPEHFFNIQFVCIFVFKFKGDSQHSSPYSPIKSFSSILAFSPEYFFSYNLLHMTYGNGGYFISTIKFKHNVLLMIA